MGCEQTFFFFSNPPNSVSLPTGHILQSPSANVLPTLPFHVLRALFSSTPLTTDDGVLLRRMALEIGAIHLILACLSALSHHAPRVPSAGTNQAEVRLASAGPTVCVSVCLCVSLLEVNQSIGQKKISHF